jgi:hypothetical protein
LPENIGSIQSEVIVFPMDEKDIKKAIPSALLAISSIIGAGSAPELREPTDGPSIDSVIKTATEVPAKSIPFRVAGDAGCVAGCGGGGGPVV